MKKGCFHAAERHHDRDYATLSMITLAHRDHAKRDRDFMALVIGITLQRDVITRDREQSC